MHRVIIVSLVGAACVVGICRELKDSRRRFRLIADRNDGGGGALMDVAY